MDNTKDNDCKCNIAEMLNNKDMIGAKKCINKKLMEKIHDMIEEDKYLVSEEMFGIDEESIPLAEKTPEQIKAKNDKKLAKIKSNNEKNREANRVKNAKYSAKKNAKKDRVKAKFDGKAHIKTDNKMAAMRNSRK